MPIASTNIVLNYNSRNYASLFQSLSIDESVIHELTMTSNQSALVINFGGVSTGQMVFLETDQNISFLLNSGTSYILNSYGFLVISRTSMAAITLTNEATTSLAIIRVAVLGT